MGLVGPGRGLQQKLTHAQQEGPRCHRGILSSLDKIPEIQRGFVFPKKGTNQPHVAMGRMLSLTGLVGVWVVGLFQGELGMGSSPGVQVLVTPQPKGLSG